MQGDSSSLANFVANDRLSFFLLSFVKNYPLVKFTGGRAKFPNFLRTFAEVAFRLNLIDNFFVACNEIFFGFA